MKLFVIGSDKVLACLKDFSLTEAGIQPIFNTKKVYSEKDVEEVFREEKNYCCFLTPNSSLTFHAFKAFSKNNPGAGIIAFSSRPESWLAKLVDERILVKDNLILVGTRDSDEGGKRFLEYNRVKNYSMREISFEEKREIADSIMSVARQWSKAYLLVNLEVLDPAFAPGASIKSPGGLSTRELLYFIHRIKMLRNIGMVQVTGYCEEVDELTARTAAKLVAELF